MYKLEFRNGLLYTSVELEHGDRKTVVSNVIVDTGAAHTIILTEYLEELDAPLNDDDELVKSSGYGGIVLSAVRKKIGKMSMGDIVLEDIKLDFGIIDPYERLNGLIGLDFLKAAGVIIDLENLTVYQKSHNI